MRKLFIITVMLALASWTISSCGGKKEEDKKEGEEEYSDYETAEPKKESSDDLIAQGKVLVDGSDCKTCHHATNKIVGPPHADVAKKYEFTKANVSYLAGKIIDGGSGVWGEVPMTPHADISKADAEKMAMYVLSLDGEKPVD
ncbi:MAG TPA: c-type cytochrome [Chryseosolibacter sp.]|nr:c-type cytochrome [Chryseosolibacter sp.]